MIKSVKYELRKISAELKELDSKSVIILVIGVVLLTISWYFANPNFYRTSITSIEHNSIIIEELSSFIYWFLLDFLLFFIIPISIIKYIFKENLKDYGLVIKNKNIGFIYAGTAFLIFIPILILVSNSNDFTDYFPLMSSAKDDPAVFFIYEIFFVTFIFSWEFIFRGFILFGLEKKFGLHAVFIQMIPFVLLHLGKPFIETFASILGALFLGYLAIRTRSIFYGFILHMFILVLLDILAFFK